MSSRVSFNIYYHPTKFTVLVLELILYGILVGAVVAGAALAVVNQLDEWGEALEDAVYASTITPEDNESERVRFRRDWAEFVDAARDRRWMIVLYAGISVGGMHAAGLAAVNLCTWLVTRLAKTRGGEFYQMMSVGIRTDMIYLTIISGLAALVTWLAVQSAWPAVVGLLCLVVIIVVGYYVVKGSIIGRLTQIGFWYGVLAAFGGAAVGNSLVQGLLSPITGFLFNVLFVP